MFLFGFFCSNEYIQKLFWNYLTFRDLHPLRYVHCTSCAPAVANPGTVGKTGIKKKFWILYFTGFCCPKGQLISKCPFGVIVSTKIPMKKFDKFCPRIWKSGHISKIKALAYNKITYLWLYGLFNVLKTLWSTLIL